MTEAECEFHCLVCGFKAEGTFMVILAAMETHTCHACPEPPTTEPDD